MTAEVSAHRDSPAGGHISAGGFRSRRAELLRLVQIELRASPLVYLVPVLIGVGVWAAFYVSRPGVWYWPSALMAANVSQQLLGPAFTGLAALTAIREHRRRTAVLRRLAVRPGWAFPIAELAAVAMWALLVHAAVVVMLGVWMLVNGAVGPVDPAMVLSGFLSALFHVALGYLAGRLAPWPFVLPLAAVGAYLLAVVAVTQAHQDWYLLTPVLNELVSGWSQPQAGLYWAHALWLVGATAVFAVGAAWVVERRRRLAGPFAAVVVVAVAGAALVSTFEGRFHGEEEPAFTYQCRSEQVTICVHPAYRDALPGLHARFGPMAERLADSPLGYTRLEQRPRGIDQDPSPGSRAIHLDQVDEATLDRTVQDYFEQPLDFDACTAAAAGGDGAAHSDLVLKWFGTTVSWVRGPTAWPRGADEARHVPAELEAEHDFLTSLDETQAREWFARHYDAFAECRLTPEDFRLS